MTTEELAADTEVVPSAPIIGVREVIADAPHVLVLVPRVELISRDLETRERDARRARGDAIGLLPVVRPFREVVVLEVEERVPHFDFIERTVAQHLRQLTETFVVVFGCGVRRCGMLHPAEAERLP